MKQIFLTIVATLILCTSCTEYSKILKSTDPDFKYDKAVEYYSNKKFDKAISLFSDVSQYYRNTERSELIINYLAMSHFYKKEYFTAKSYYETYVKSFPAGRFVEEAKYQIGYCDYMDVPDVRLDQTTTKLAIQELQNFIDQYPDTERAKDAAKLLDELNNKLAEKELQNATLYYNLGIYLGNNYLSAIITAENALKKYPSNKFREDFMILVLKSKYQQALYSTEEMKNKRYQETLDEYYSYINEFPEGKYTKEAKHIFSNCEKAESIIVKE